MRKSSYYAEETVHPDGPMAHHRAALRGWGLPQYRATLGVPPDIQPNLRALRLSVRQYWTLQTPRAGLDVNLSPRSITSGTQVLRVRQHSSHPHPPPNPMSNHNRTEVRLKSSKYQARWKYEINTRKGKLTHQN